MASNSISGIGEFGLIERLSAIAGPTLEKVSGVIEGIGDDCTVFRTEDGLLQVATTDLLVEQVHFDLLTTPMHHLGSKAISVNVSDICAMNAIPRYALVSIAIPRSTPVEMVEALYNGMAHTASRYGVAIAGGDTSSSPSGLVISVAVTGATTKERLTLRKGARPGDLVCVTGTLGGSTAGLRVLMRERSVMMEMFRNNEPYNKDVMAELGTYTEVIRRHLLPEARLDIVRFFHEKCIVPTAMIDISDGLAADLGHLCRRSETGAHLQESRIPVLPEAREVAEEFQDDPLTWALSGGEEYQLLFTIAPEHETEVRANRDISVIGRVTEKENGILLNDIYGMTADLATMQGGYNHFRE